MDPEYIIYIVVLILLLLLSSFFSCSETALTTVSRVRIETLSKEDSVEGNRAKRLLKVTDNKAKMLSAILIGNNLVNIMASSLATSIAIKLFGSMGVGIATGILTFLILIFGEITPKSFATQNATSISLRVSGPILFCMYIFTPIIFFLDKLVGKLVFGKGKNEQDEGVMTSEELITVVNISHEKGSIEEEEKDYIENLFDFSDARAKEVMTPRIDVTAINIDWSFEKILEIFKETMYTRYPVYDKDGEKIKGIINIKDLILYDKSKEFMASDYVREAFFTYELKKTSELFGQMRENSISMAIVLDEYGGMAGVLTLEDLLEELVGEIRDEYDESEVDDVTPLSEREFEVLGSANLEDLCDELPLGFSSDDYDTIGGYLVGLFDHFPKSGETFVTEDGIILRVSEVSSNRVEKIRIRFPAKITELEG